MPVMNDSNSRYRVLVVDDAPIVCEALHYVLEDTPDLEMVGAAIDGLEALVCAMILEPDVVVLDIHMPGIDGYAVARELKSMPTQPVIIFLTVDDDLETQRRAMEAGGDSIVTKAQGWDALLAQIRASMDPR
jgi:DNA-binding NarL/FixJ family response regulator